MQLTKNSELLKTFRRPIPDWLHAAHSLADAALLEGFLASPLVFYPGSGFDGQAVKDFGSAHAAHCFIYADYLIEESKLRAELSDASSPFKGYRSIKRVSFDPAVVSPFNELLPRFDGRSVMPVAPYCFLEILERNSDLTDEHGAERMAILFAGMDAYACFDAIFNGTQRQLLALVLQDHGFGGNYSRFGRGGLLEDIAQKCGTFPEMMLVGQNTNPWTGYAPIKEAAMGRHPYARIIFERVCRNRQT